jgi:hypothetical protein
MVRLSYSTQAGCEFCSERARAGGTSAVRSMFLDGLGALATTFTVVAVLIAKFREGAWIAEQDL